MKLKAIIDNDTSQYIIFIGDGDDEFLSTNIIYKIYDLYVKSKCDNDFRYGNSYKNINVIFIYYNKTNVYGIKYFTSWCKKYQIELILSKIAPPDFSGIKSVAGNIRAMEITKQKKIKTIYRDWDVIERFGK